MIDFYKPVKRNRRHYNLWGVVSLVQLFLLISYTTAWAQCDVPTNRSSSNFTAVSADLAWDAVVGADSYTINYRVVGATTWIAADAPSNNFTLSGLLSGTQYVWKVQSVCGEERSSFTVPAIIFTTTGPPTCPRPVGQSEQSLVDVSVILDWSDVLLATGYVVQYREISNPTWTEVSTTPSFFNLMGLTAETQYVWKVRSICSVADVSKFTQGRVFKTLPDCEVPSNLSSGNIMDNSADLNWDDAFDAISYDVQYRVRGVSTWTTTNVATSNVGLVGLESGLVYQWRVRTVCTGNVLSTYAAIEIFTTTGTPSCPVPANLVSSNITDNTVDLDWDAVGTAISYSVQHRVLGATNWTTTTTATNSLTLAGLEPGLSYQWKVQTQCSQSVVSGYSNPVLFVTTGTPNCATPSNLAASNLTDTTADLDWDVATGAISYIVQYKVIGAPDWIETTAPANSITLTGLSSGQTYQYRVRSFCSSEIVSAFSDSEFFDTTGTPDCGIPDNRQTINITNNSAQISWDAVGSALSYIIFFRETGAPTWTETTTTNTTTTLAGLNPETTYEWKIRSVCAADNSLLSVFSDSEVFTTLATPGNFESADQISVRSMQGNLITTVPGGQSIGELVRTLNLQRGLYILSITEGTQVTNRRIAIN